MDRRKKLAELQGKRSKSESSASTFGCISTKVKPNQKKEDSSDDEVEESALGLEISA